MSTGRICFLFACKDNLTELPKNVKTPFHENVEILDPNNGNGITIRGPGQYPESDFLLKCLGKHTISSAIWYLHLVLPVSLNWRRGAAALRFMRRVALAYPVRIAGPWSLKSFAEKFPVIADKILYQHKFDEAGNDLGKVAGAKLQAPNVMVGDVPEMLLDGDYRPTDTNCINDVEPNPASIYPADETM